MRGHDLPREIGLSHFLLGCDRIDDHQPNPGGTIMTTTNPTERTARFENRTMTMRKWESTKTILKRGFDAKIKVREYPFGDQGVELLKLVISFPKEDESLCFMTMEERRVFDGDSKWQKMLDFCQQRGFQEQEQ
jgi:hypothetical protein